MSNYIWRWLLIGQVTYLVTFSVQMKRVLLLLVLVILSCVPDTYSQVFPKEGSMLNYRLIGFSIPATSKMERYSLEVALGKSNTEPDFTNNKVLQLEDNRPFFMAKVPAFGKDYTWRISIVGAKAGKFHYFSTGIVPAVDTSSMRLRIMQKATAFENAVILLDGNRVMYDMAGDPIWYLPDIEGLLTESAALRDLKITDKGTITFLLGEPTGEKAYEVDYSGKVLWKGPDDGRISGDSIEYYHHEFTRQSSGSYLVLGSEYKYSPVSTFSKAGKSISDEVEMHARQKQPFGTIIEYDSSNKIKWVWKSYDYFKQAGIKDLKKTNTPAGIDVHQNAFYKDNHSNMVYVSFKNINRILKIHYPDGKVVADYDNTDASGERLFCGQHACKRSSNGYIYLFNNNVCEASGKPQIVAMKEPTTANGKLTKLWSFEMPIDELDPNNHSNFFFPSGGNVVELKDNSFFISMSCSYSKLLIIDKQQKTLWSAMPEKWNLDVHKWMVAPQYRASITTDTLLIAKMIWQAQSK